MSILSKIKSKDKKALTIAFIVVAVTITSFSMGAYCISSALLSKGSISGRLANNQRTSQVHIEKSTQANTSVDTSVNVMLAKESAVISKNNTYTVHLAEGLIKEKLNLKWSSDNTKVATVSKNGVVTAVSAGTANISCVNLDNKSSDTIKITVSAPVYATEVKLDKSSYMMTATGELLKLNAELLPKNNVTNTKLNWSTSDKSVATVKDGVVTAVSEGKATITCTTANGKTAKCEITVEPQIKAEELTLDYIGYDFDGPQTEPVLLTPTIYPPETSNQKLKWRSTNENVALVDEQGYVTVVGDGECDIICTTTDGTYLSAICEVTAVNTMLIVTHTTTQTVYVPVNPVVANSVLEEALRYVGVIPYVWGGTDLSSGVDCSGFICAVYERFGVNLWGVRTDLYLAGIEVPSIEYAQAGDILCYPGHVAIYDGNGGRVHAYDEGYMIMRDQNIGGYYTIRRIIQ
ncbi:MAG: Ig-like domain-containing protein [Acutalibacteraceae bacterium]|nr:Ig-like domain-containing protein [Acutalibacteraceae bacterium]